MNRVVLASFLLVCLTRVAHAEELVRGPAAAQNVAFRIDAPAEGSPNAEQLAHARLLFDQGLVKVREHDYASARAAFEEAYRLAPRAAVLFNIARAAEALGDSGGAIAAYEKYLELTETPHSGVERGERAEAALRLRALRGAEQAPALRRGPEEQLVLVRVQCPWPGFLLVQGDRTLGMTPAEGTLGVASGLSVEVRRAGYVTQEVDLSSAGASPVIRCLPQIDNSARVPSGELHLSSAAPNTRFVVDGKAVSSLVRLPVGPHVVQAQALGRGATSRTVQLKSGETLTITLTPLPLSEAASPARPQRWIGGALATLGGVALGASVALFVDNEARFARFQAESRQIQALPLSEPTRQTRAQAANGILTDVQTIDAVNWIVAASGAALVTTGTTLFFWPRAKAEVRLGGVSFRVDF